MQHKMAVDDIIKYKIPQRRNKVHGCGILYIDNKAVFRTAGRLRCSPPKPEQPMPRRHLVRAGTHL